MEILVQSTDNTYSHLSYGSIAGSNPFNDDNDHLTQFGDLLEETMRFNNGDHTAERGLNERPALQPTTGHSGEPNGGPSRFNAELNAERVKNERRVAQGNASQFGEVIGELGRFDINRIIENEGIIGADVERAFKERPAGQPTARHTKMAHSLSEGNMEFSSCIPPPLNLQPYRMPSTGETLVRRSSPEHANPHRMPFTDEDTTPRASIDTDRSGITMSPTRSFGGNPLRRSLSPVRNLSMIREVPSFVASETAEIVTPEETSVKTAVETAVEGPVEPPKRSRSPVKQLFGERGMLGKSMSMKDFQESEGGKKKGLKGLGEKIKKGIDALVVSLTMKMKG